MFRKEKPMGKINYRAIVWDAGTYGEFCGSPANLNEMFDRVGKYPGHRGMRLADFVYKVADPVFAYAKGDVVTTVWNPSRFATVTGKITEDDFRRYLEIQFADGTVTTVGSDKVAESIAPADIPEELIALARAEAEKVREMTEMDTDMRRSRAEVLYCLDVLVRHLSDEDVMNAWLAVGIPDGTLEKWPTDEQVDPFLAYAEDKKEFENLVKTALAIIRKETHVTEHEDRNRDDNRMGEGRLGGRGKPRPRGTVRVGHSP